MWVALASLLCFQATAQEPVLIDSPDLPVTAISEHLSVLVDPDDRLSVSQIIQGTFDDQFQKNSRPIVSIGFSKATIWVRCPIENRLGHDAALVVESSMARLSHADWFLVQDGKVIQNMRSGAMDLPKGLAAADQYPRIEFTAPAKKKLLYLCAKSDTAMWFPLIMGSQTQFKGFERRRLMLEFFLLSVCTMIFGISILIGISNRQWMYVSLAITAIAYALIFAIFNGHVRSMIPNLPIWWERQFYGALTVAGLLILISIDRKVFDLRAFPRIIAAMRWSVITLLLVMFNTQQIVTAKLLSGRGTVFLGNSNIELELGGRASQRLGAYLRKETL